MDVFRGSESIDPALREPVVAIGNFDGVHVGHQALVALARERAGARSGTVVVLTFDPHPAKVLAPKLAPPLITPLSRKLELLAAAGVDACLIVPFTPALAASSAPDFVDHILCEELRAREVVVGHDFTYGAGRLGTVDTLRAQGAKRGISVSVIPAITMGGLVASSTKVRELALEGNVEGVRLLLGRELDLDGLVVRGAARGRTLGFPTANIAHDNELVPKPGVYVGHATVLSRGERFGAAINLGSSPTFQTTGTAALEAHILDFEGDLYDERLRIEFHGRLRGERRFSSPAALAEQIRLDTATARAQLADAAEPRKDLLS